MTSEVRLRDGIRTCLVVFVVARAALFVVSAVGVGLMDLPPGQPTSVTGWAAHPVTPGLANLFTATERQDALWFLRISAEGYRGDDLSAAFFPLYPMVVRVVGWLPGVGTLASALLVSNLSFLGSLVMAHGLARREPGVDADRAVRYLAAFPTAFFLMAPYSESLYLLLVLGAFWFAGRGRWPAGGLAALGAGLARSVGVMVAPALGLEALRAHDRARPAVRVAAASAPLVGAALYLGAWGLATGDPLAPLRAQEAWRPELSAPWSALARGISFAVRYRGWWLVDATIVLGALAALVAGARRLRPSYTVFGLGSLVLPLFAMFPDRPLLSMPRFCCVLFPISFVLARQRFIPDVAVTTVLALGWVGLAVAFVNWGYIF